MGDSTGISWTDATWNPVRGCSRVSAGCMNCYAERTAARFCGAGQPYEGLAKRSLRTVDANDPDAAIKSVSRWTGEVRLVAEHLADPLKWRKPRRIFVNSMSDLFHEKLADSDIDQVLAVMLLAPRHTFQVLTKRPARMRSYLSDAALYDRVLSAAGRLRDVFPQLNQIAIENPVTRPAPWIWWGASVENQDALDDRWPHLHDTPAAVRFFSAEPLLGPLDFTRAFAELSCELGDLWMIAGCESGPGARPCDVEWLRSLRDQCATAGVPFFLKQATPTGHPFIENGGSRFRITDGAIRSGDGSKVKGGTPPVIEMPYLDGVQHKEFPK